LLTRHAGSPDAARELLHDTWLRLARAELPPAANASAYAYATARHLLVDQHRHHSTARAIEAAAAQPDATDIDTTARVAAHRQALAAVERALAALPRRTCEIFLRHRLLDTPQAELAATHGVSLATVEREVARGATAVQRALAPWQAQPAGTAPTARRRGLGTLLGLTALLGSGGLSWRLWQAQVPQWQVAWRTQRGQQARHTLPDGSDLTLDAQTTLELDFYGSRRHGVLHAGAVFFDIARDPARPFTLDCGAVRVTVLGTRFVVECQADQVRVDVEHGRVRVERMDASATTDGTQRGAVELGAGDSLLVDTRSHAGLPAPEVSAAAAAPWRDGRLGFDRATLAEIAERLSRYHPRALEVDPRVAGWRVTAEMRIGLADEWLRHVLPRSLAVRVVDTATGLRIEPRR
jgi:RNA polymerase sigma factor (sigma-70 family)